MNADPGSPRRHSAFAGARVPLWARVAILVAVGGAAIFFAHRTVRPHPKQRPPGALPTPAPESAITRRVDVDRLLADVRYLASPELEGRFSGSPGGVKARSFIAARFSRDGLEPLAPGYLQIFSFNHTTARRLLALKRPATLKIENAANVVGRIPGGDPSKRAIVVSAHYDHLGIRDGKLYPGADDNASGVAVLLGAADELATHHPAHTFVLVAFDAEELDLEGSRKFVADPPVALERIALDVNLDMLSRNDVNEIYVAGAELDPGFRRLVGEVQRHAGVKLLFGHDLPKKADDDPDDWTDESDQGAFAKRKIPWLYFGVEDHADYHKPTDTADRIDPRFYRNVADAVLETLATLDRELP